MEKKPPRILKQEVKRGKLFPTMRKGEKIYTDTLVYKKDKSKIGSTKVIKSDSEKEPPKDVSSVSTTTSSVNPSTSCSDTSGGDDG